MMNPSERELKEDELYDILRREAEGQYGAPGSYELEVFMNDVSNQIDVMSDEELDQELASRK